MIVSFNISKDQLDRVEQIARQRRMTTGENANRSSEVGRAIDSLFLAECLINTSNDVAEIASEPAEKTITPIFTMSGKKRKLVGFDAFYGDHLIGRFDDRESARAALDAFVYEELQAA